MLIFKQDFDIDKEIIALREAGFATDASMVSFIKNIY